MSWVGAIPGEGREYCARCGFTINLTGASEKGKEKLRGILNDHLAMCPTLPSAQENRLLKRACAWLGPMGVVSGASIGAILALPGFLPLAVGPAMLAVVCFAFYYLFADLDLKDKQLDEWFLGEMARLERGLEQDLKRIRATTTSARVLDHPALPSGGQEEP
jgi:hypothetical protein